MGMRMRGAVQSDEFEVEMEWKRLGAPSRLPDWARDSEARPMTEEERVEELAALAYEAYWERLSPKTHKTTPFKRQSEPYKGDWRRVVRAVLDGAEKLK